jgi:YesN/AraC family two-component response regulator
VGTAELAQALARQGLEAGNGAEKKTILIVDDEPAILDLHARMVEAESGKYRVLKAREGREALNVLERERVDLVLLDLMMPGVDGFGVLEAMRERESTREVPVIVLTGQALTAEDMRRLNRGVSAVLGKGMFSAVETLEHLRAALARNRKLGSEAQRLVRKGMAYVHAHYAEAITRESIARHIGVSQGHLTRCFRQELGVTPMVYLNRYRINQAKALLAQREKNVTEVALAVGFSNITYFSQVFRREVGVAPSGYKEARLSGAS